MSGGQSLRDLRIRTDDGDRWIGHPLDGDRADELTRRPGYEMSREAAPVTTLFENLPEQCCVFIAGADLITGCVAWLTNDLILTALSEIPSVSIIVQKEDFLRPDNPAQYKSRLRQKYERLHPLWRVETDHTEYYSTCSGSSVEDCAVRCMGIVNRGQRIAVPRMHHKFLVRCENSYCQDRGECKWQWQGEPCRGHPKPTAVWTGSFNMTHNGAASLENAVVITDPVIAQRYQTEWAWVFGLSEPLDWEHDWVEPELRIGS